MKNQINLKKASIKNLDALQEIAIQTFTETYQSKNTKENFENYINTAFNKIQLTKELICPESEFYFAQQGQKLVGYIKVNELDAQTEYKKIDALEIERIYVLHAEKEKGFGRLLIEKAIEIALLKNKKTIWLGVWQENPKAISFYKRMAFKVTDTHIFKVGDEDQIDYVMELDLSAHI